MERDSTLLWSEQLPNNWRTLPLKRVVELRTDRVIGNSDKEDYLGLENIESWTGRLLKSQAIKTASDDEANDKGVVGTLSL